MKLYVLLVCVCVSFSPGGADIVRRVTHTCGPESYFTKDNGVITSHTGMAQGHNYGKDLDCLWTIEAPHGFHVLLTAESFNVHTHNPCTDYLQLYDGNSTSSPRLTRYCGSNFTPVTSTGNFMTLEFVTDTRYSGLGFRLHYNYTLQTVTPAPLCPVGQFACDNYRCISSRYVCDSRDTCGDNSDEFNCNYTCAYNQFQCNNGKCIPKNYQCDNDNDCGDNSDEVCTTSTASTTTTTQRTCASDEFRCGTGLCVSAGWLCDGDADCSDGSDEVAANCHSGTGGTGNTGTSSSSSMCGTLARSGATGTLTTPNYPNRYQNNLHCVWKIQGPPGTKTIDISFNTPFDIELDGSCSYDSVSVYFTGHVSTHGPYCGSSTPGQFSITGSHVLVDFKSDNSDNFRGFSLTWTAHQ